jgi:hypothetical protein
VAEDVTTEDADRPLSDVERLAAHRALGLLALGFTLQQVLVLARIPDIVHQAEALVNEGCPPEIAFDILT